VILPRRAQLDFIVRRFISLLFAAAVTIAISAAVLGIVFWEYFAVLL
jgi:hypothetical protein